MSTNENSKVPQNETTWVAPKKTLAQRMKPYLGFYLMFLPVFIFVLIVYYWPMLGVRYAFYTYKLRDIHWIGLGNFAKLFAEKEFWSAFVICPCQPRGWARMIDRPSCRCRCGDAGPLLWLLLLCSFGLVVTSR